MSTNIPKKSRWSALAISAVVVFTMTLIDSVPGLRSALLVLGDEHPVTVDVMQIRILYGMPAVAISIMIWRNFSNALDEPSYGHQS